VLGAPGAIVAGVALGVVVALVSLPAVGLSSELQPARHNNKLSVRDTGPVQPLSANARTALVRNRNVLDRFIDVLLFAATYSEAPYEILS
jgi:hypothetical protein